MKTVITKKTKATILIGCFCLSFALAETEGKKTYITPEEQKAIDNYFYAALKGELEEEKTSIEQALCSGTLGNDELVVKSRRIQDVIALIDEKTMRWLELSEFA